MTAGRSIDYDVLTQDALRGIVRTVLMQVVKSGLPGDHHFYIAFGTQSPGVVLSRRLKEKYPEEMTIVLQHRFWDLAVTDESFEVKLTFDGIPERLCVPFSALHVFVDPSVRFTLQFGDHGTQEDGQDAAGGRRRRRDGGVADAAGGPRGVGERRPRRSKPRSERDDGQDIDAAQADQAAPATLKPVAEPSAKPAVVPAAVDPPAALPPAAVPPAAQIPTAPRILPTGPAPENGGAKVLSLDKFRKK